MHLKNAVRVFVGALVLPVAAVAQTPRTTSATPAPRVSFAAGYEVHRDRLRYRFENPSNYDTAFLVPHYFEQTYVADNQWLTGSAQYSLFGDRLETEAAFTPEITTSGKDFDTFFNPGGDVIVYGTGGDVRMRSFRFAQWSEARLARLTWRLGYIYRRDRSQFLPTDRIVIHSSPPSETRSPTFGRERTISEVHQIPIDVSGSRAWSPRWTFITAAQLSPLVWSTLTTHLPDKYPGQPIVFAAKALEWGGRLQLVRDGRWPIIIGLSYAKTVSYRATSEIHRSGLQLSVRIAS